MASIPPIGHEFFKVIEERLGPRLGKLVANTLLVLIVIAIAVICVSVIGTYAVAPFSKFIAGLIAGVKVGLTARDWEAAVLTALFTWLVFRLLVNAWMRDTRRLIENLDQSQANARKIIGDVRVANDEAHKKITEIFENARKESANLTAGYSADIQSTIKEFLDTVKQIISDSLTPIEERLRNVERRLPTDES